MPAPRAPATAGVIEGAAGLDAVEVSVFCAAGAVGFDANAGALSGEALGAGLSGIDAASVVSSETGAGACAAAGPGAPGGAAGRAAGALGPVECQGWSQMTPPTRTTAITAPVSAGRLRRGGSG